MFQIPSRVWGLAVGQHVWNVPPTAPLPHAVKKKRISLTLLLQNHLDHLNYLLLDLRHWHIHDLLHDSFPHPLLQNHLDHFNTLLQDLLYRNIPRSAQLVHVHPCCRLTPVRALHTTSPATSSTIFLQDLWHWHIHDLLHDKILHALPWHMLRSPSKICGTGSATICSTTICSRLVIGHGTRGTQHHHVCNDV